MFFYFFNFAERVYVLKYYLRYVYGPRPLICAKLGPFERKVTHAYVIPSSLFTIKVRLHMLSLFFAVPHPGVAPGEGQGAIASLSELASPPSEGEKPFSSTSENSWRHPWTHRVSELLSSQICYEIKGPYSKLAQT